MRYFPPRGLIRAVTRGTTMTVFALNPDVATADRTRLFVAKLRDQQPGAQISIGVNNKVVVRR